MNSCHSCGNQWLEREAPGFSATCEKCGEFLHCCRNCRFHSPGMHNDCCETQAEMVRDKENRNRCEWFQFADRDADGNTGELPDRSAAARARLEELFGPPGKKPGDSPE